jgi:glutathionylspermidine synthase
MIFECCKWDIQREDHSVLARYALVLDGGHWAAVAEMAEQLDKEALTLEQELLTRADLHADLGLPKPIRALLRHLTRISDTRSTRVMRFDFHLTTEGWKISEVNSDVPGGFIESSGFTERLAEYYPGMRPVGNPSRAYSEAIRRLVGHGGYVALVHATAYSDDRQVMEYLAKQLRALDLRTTLISPAHLRFEHQQAVIRSRFWKSGWSHSVFSRGMAAEAGQYLKVGGFLLRRRHGT